jgi:tol-pal system protein YbgF
LTGLFANGYDRVVLVCAREFWWIPALFGVAIGCVSGANSGGITSGKLDDERILLNKLQERAKLQSDRIAELEVRISLLEAEAKEIRVKLSPSRDPARETVRIGSRPSAERQSTLSGEEMAGPRPSRSGRPVLRLYSQTPHAERASFAEFPAPPPGVPEQLPVAALPDIDNKSAPRPSSEQASESSGQADLNAYREALALVRKRQFDEAQRALTAFLVRYPNHSYSDNALYWLGEVFYAKREYQRALEQFEALAGRFPTSNKMPDALLKTGMCYRRLGDVNKARDIFRRVYSEYPKSDAARIALREGA